MARSPWKFLARLTGRGRQAQADLPTEDEAGKGRSDERQDQVPLITPPEPTPPATESVPEFDQALDVHSEDKDDGASTTAVLEEPKPDMTAAETDAALSQSKDTNRSKSTERLARPAEQTAGSEVSSEARIAAPTASDEFLMLDGEIQELRRQLSAKLRSQNAQLKKMLDRFDR